MDSWLGLFCFFTVCIGGVILTSFIAGMFTLYFINRRYKKGAEKIKTVVLPKVANNESTIVIDVEMDCLGFNSLAVSYISLLNNNGYVLQSQSDGIYTFYKKFDS